MVVVKAVVRGDCCRSAILKCFLGGRNKGVSGIGEVFGGGDGNGLVLLVLVAYGGWW